MFPMLDGRVDSGSFALCADEGVVEFFVYFFYCDIGNAFLGERIGKRVAQ